MSIRHVDHLAVAYEATSGDLRPVGVQLFDEAHRVVVVGGPEEEVFGELLRVVAISPGSGAESDRVDIVMVAVENQRPGQPQAVLEMLERLVVAEGRKRTPGSEVDDLE